MYYLFKLKTSELEASIFNHPLSAVDASEDLSEIAESIKKRVGDGCPKSRLMIFEKIDYSLDIGVVFDEENDD